MPSSIPVPLQAVACLLRKLRLPGGISLSVAFLLAQATRPGTGTTPGGAANPGGGGVVAPPNGGGGATAGLRITTDTGVLIGDVVTATLAGLTNAAGASYQWTISGGRILTDATRPTIQFTADAAGTVTLNVVVTPANGSGQSATVDITVISPALAGTITTGATVKTATAGLSATVPAAQDGDRTFRWTLGGTGGAITGGQGTNTITFRAGAAGLLEVNCEVTLQRLVAVPLRAFVVVQGEGAPVLVTVNNGAGGGTYPAGSRVDIFADPPAAGQVFDRWTGDVAALGSGALAPLNAHGILTVPTSAVALTATYKTAAAWTPTVVANFNPVTQAGANNATTTVSTTLAYFIPANASAVVFLLHDTGDAATRWFTRPEESLLARDLVAAGYGVAALNSVNRAAGTWAAQTTLANNLDAANLAAALDKFAKDGALAATKPVFLLGLGEGADAAARFAEMLATATPARAVRGVVLYCATGGNTLAVTSRVPEFFALAANDDTLGTTGNTTARDNSDLLAGRGVATAVTASGASPVHERRFRALSVSTATFTTADAQAMWSAVKAAGLLDANNYVKALPTLAALRSALPTALQPRADDALQELSVAYAAREFYADANARVIAFLNARVAGTPAPTPGRLANLSTRTKIGFAGDSFTLGFNISGPEKATLLIRGIGPALARFGLGGALAAPRLEVNQGAAIIATNESWEKAANRAQLVIASAAVGAFALTAGDADAAVLLTLDPGTYTATIRGLNGATGDVLAEVYDVSKNATRLTNLSTLAAITEEGAVITPGIVIQGNNPRTIVARAVAPGLADFGLPDSALLGDPRITILTSANGATTTVATNNNWAQAAGGAAGATTVSQAAALNAVFPAVGAFALKAANSDAALVTALSPGNFTLQAGAAPVPTGAQLPANFVTPNQTGQVLVEVYEVP